MSNIKDSLQELLKTPVDPIMFPEKKGNRINIGSYSIKKVKTGYSIHCYKNHQVIAETFSKAAAIAIVKALHKKRGDGYIERLKELDNHLSKHYIDCIFYKHNMKKAKDDVRFEILNHRYEISSYEIGVTKEKLESFIF